MKIEQYGQISIIFSPEGVPEMITDDFVVKDGSIEELQEFCIQTLINLSAKLISLKQGESYTTSNSIEPTNQTHENCHQTS